MFYVYILRSINNPEQTYIGCTNNLKERINTHNNGKSIHTNRYKPWTLEFYSAFKTKEMAFKFEQYLKTPNGEQLTRKHFLLSDGIGSTCTT